MSDTNPPEGHVDEVGCWCGPTVHPVSGLGHTLAVTAPVDRPGPTEPTDADREKAAELLIDPVLADVVSGYDLTDARDRIAAAFAEIRAAEREAALAPVLTLADELEDEAQEALEKYPSNGFDVPIVRDLRASANSASFIADRIRAALAPLAGQHTTDEEANRG